MYICILMFLLNGTDISFQTRTTFDTEEECKAHISRTDPYIKGVPPSAVRVVGLCEKVRKT